MLTGTKCFFNYLLSRYTTSTYLYWFRSRNFIHKVVIQYPAPYTGWKWHVFTLIWCKKLYRLLEKIESKRKEAGVGPFKIISFIILFPETKVVYILSLAETFHLETFLWFSPPMGGLKQITLQRLSQTKTRTFCDFFHFQTTNDAKPSSWHFARTGL